MTAVARLGSGGVASPYFAMNSSPLRFRALSLLLAASAMGAPVTGQAQTPKRTNPTSKMYVAELKGESSVDDGKTVQRLAKDGVVAPEGSVFETKPNSNDSLVLSNGTAMFVDSDTRFEVRRFLQEPFAPNRNELDVEPSVSQIVIQLARGGLGFCTAKPVAGSSMVIQTPQATIDVKGRRVMIQTTAQDTRVSLLEGELTVVGDPAKGGAVLLPGQQIVVHRETPESAPTTVLKSLSKEENAALDELVSLACISRRTVFFESVPRSENGTTTDSELVPVRTTAARAPVQFTVSPARLNP